MSWYDIKQAAVDPDNPAANEQIPFSEWNAMVAYQKDKIVDKTVNTAAIGNDKVLVYKTATNTFVFEAPSAVGAIDDLSDVTISGVPADNEVLAYDTGTSEWINQTAAEAGLATTTQLTTLETAAVLEADFDATTFLYATADNTPLPKTRAETMAILSGTAAAEFLFNTQRVGGIVDPTTAQQASTKNYADTTLFTKEAVTAFTDGYIPVYRTASGKFEMEIQSAALGLPVADTTTIIKGSADGTKLLRFEVDGFTSGNTRIATFPDKDFTVCGTDEVMLLSGTQPMAGDLNMGDYDIIGMNHVKAYDGAGVRGISNASVTRIDLATADYAFQAHAPADMNNQDIINIGKIIIHDTMELTIASGVISVSYSSHTVDTEADAATDDLDTINGGTAGMTLMIRAINSARTVVAKNGTGNLLLEADRTLDNAADTLSLYYDGSNWLETGFANNGA